MRFSENTKSETTTKNTKNTKKNQYTKRFARFMNFEIREICQFNSKGDSFVFEFRVVAEVDE
ncbi:hypothetical protein BH10PLA2_BH10PLA2_07840 [soil metagenome]